MLYQIDYCTERQARNRTGYTSGSASISGLPEIRLPYRRHHNRRTVEGREMHLHDGLRFVGHNIPIVSARMYLLHQVVHGHCAAGYYAGIRARTLSAE